MTPEQIIEQAFALFAPDEAEWAQYKARRDGLLSSILAYGDARAREERERTLKEAASAVSLMFVNDPHAIHPDIAFDAMNDVAQTVAHTTAQNAARLIMDLLG